MCLSVLKKLHLQADKETHTVDTFYSSKTTRLSVCSVSKYKKQNRHCNHLFRLPVPRRLRQEDRVPSQLRLHSQTLKTERRKEMREGRIKEGRGGGREGEKEI